MKQQTKRAIIFACLLSVFLGIKAQERLDIGIGGGSSFYMGDINENKLFYSPGIANGVFIKLNPDDRHALSLGINRGSVSASAQDFIEEKPFLYDILAFHMKSPIWDIHVAGEVNFLPYNPMERNEKTFSPFVNIGIGMVFYNGFQRSSFSTMFGGGVKRKLTERLDMGVKWTFRKLFADNLEITGNGYDQAEELLGENPSLFHNNDWVSFAGVYLSYNISGLDTDCPAYDKNEKKRK